MPTIIAFFRGHNVAKTVWRPRSTRTRSGAHSTPPDLLPGFRSPLGDREWEGKKGQGRKGKAIEEREWTEGT